jgi:hypothetical protein
MDMSVIEGEEKPVHMNAATEYASEIHAHLREMEVSKPIHCSVHTNH